MPVRRRSTNTATSKKKQKSTLAKEVKKKQQSRTSSTLANTKPVITVTENNSTPEEILHASWKFITAFQFFYLFRSYFKIPTSFTIERLEQLLLSQLDLEDDTSSIITNSSTQSQKRGLQYTIADFMACILNPLTRQQVNNENYEDHVLKLFPEYSDRFSKLPIMDKINLLKTIEHSHLNAGEESFMAYRNETTPESIRMNPLGKDHEGWTYWYFGGTRLYREISPRILSKKSYQELPNFTFELVCSSIEEWHKIVKDFQARTSNRDLVTHICKIGLEVIDKLEAREAARLRNEAKLKKIKELELLPRKRSRRLEVKSEENAKRQRLLEIERQRIELEEIERKKQLMEAKLQAEQEKRDLKVGEARLKNEVYHYLSRLISEAVDREEARRLKELRNQTNKNTTDKEKLIKMQGWIRLLDEKVTVDYNEEKLRFVNERLNEDRHYELNKIIKVLESVLFKNTLRVYLITLMSQIEPKRDIYKKLDHIYKSLLLNRYNNMDLFCTDLNNTLNIAKEDKEFYDNSVQLLLSIFNTDKQESHEHEKMNHLNSTLSLEQTEEGSSVLSIENNFI
ncbi:uncharacterized protein BX663DRAFT_490608 [Cokeromyces recurvatus]|uniref:uncharacterized protein n=1 Tax=Cokeromyces recurvatus TaxID=90255 RepID=UPI00221EE009|nr:uncharacterized protein BX663DRAFT_490608 [Cokeromyces recurvatus]KAI7897782.1 hypothetical protein BX663DRAFT_490608 [Cokeromyces recurvatus]